MDIVMYKRYQWPTDETHSLPVCPLAPSTITVDLLLSIAFTVDPLNRIDEETIDVVSKVRRLICNDGDGVVVISSSFIELCRLMTPRWLMALLMLNPVAMDDSIKRSRTQGDDMNIIIANVKEWGTTIERNDKFLVGILIVDLTSDKVC